MGGGLKPRGAARGSYRGGGGLNRGVLPARGHIEGGGSQPRGAVRGS
jgi:hypothetical protein